MRDNINQGKEQGSLNKSVTLIKKKTPPRIGGVLFIK